MTKHHLELNLLEDEEFTLLGIRTTLEAFRFGYFLNKNLNWFLVKEAFEIHNQYPVYSYHCSKNLIDAYLIANKGIKENDTEANELFASIETQTFLVNEQKNIDYFIKISGLSENKILMDYMNKIKLIPQVQTCLELNLDDLKTTEFLIF